MIIYYIYLRRRTEGNCTRLCEPTETLTPHANNRGAGKRQGRRRGDAFENARVY